jgi:hypothetical protein
MQENLTNLKNAYLRQMMLFGALIILEAILLAVLFSSMIPPSSGDIGNPNATLGTNLTVGRTYPEVLNVSIENNNASFIPYLNTTRTILCNAILRDYDYDYDIINVNATLFDMNSSYSGAADDNNYHYTNTSCNITYNYTGTINGYTDDSYLALANCTFQVEYYANPATWRCNVWVNDTLDWRDNNNDTTVFSSLLAVEVPELLDYGVVNATSVSDEKITNISNVGNVKINISLRGYAHSYNDGWAMNCSRGNVANISVQYEKYNLTQSNPGNLNLADTEIVYFNLSSAPTLRPFGLNFRQNDTSNDAINATYWRIYVPRGVAGTCSGKVQIGASQGVGA